MGVAIGIVIRGRAAAVRSLAGALIGAKGVQHGRLTPATPGAEIK
jgi:metal-responsive CopG/Arc/MetJ family transcriptional regulator